MSEFNAPENVKNEINFLQRELIRGRLMEFFGWMTKWQISLIISNDIYTSMKIACNLVSKWQKLFILILFKTTIDELAKFSSLLCKQWGLRSYKNKAIINKS